MKTPFGPWGSHALSVSPAGHGGPAPLGIPGDPDGNLNGSPRAAPHGCAHTAAAEVAARFCASTSGCNDIRAHQCSPSYVHIKSNYIAASKPDVH